MRLILLSAIKLYWFIIPPEKRRKCIFKHSCSKFVFDVTKKDGFTAGKKALVFRLRNCNAHFDIITDYESGLRKMYLKSGLAVNESEIAERLLRSR
ncbi:membrane protein insertion efficiency factor YidD [Sphingobacterium gobiense]|uniref:Membrane protein insertion efficiency factor YidD n=1 Tax=Sphingobacterium gobiense TaxID=1382456 RepID=A0A2S9JU27_9SPHI|nr:membrane protein insertion efficiency factor YidD [Sphingobacterium gobiense]